MHVHLIFYLYTQAIFLFQKINVWLTTKVKAALNA